MHPAVEHELAIVLTGLLNACRAACDGHECYCDDDGLDGDLCHVCKCVKAIKRTADFDSIKIRSQHNETSNEPTNKQGT